MLYYIITAKMDACDPRAWTAPGGGVGVCVVDFECCIAAKIDGLRCCVDMKCTRFHALSRTLGYGRVRWRRVIHAMQTGTIGMYQEDGCSLYTV